LASRLASGVTARLAAAGLASRLAGPGFASAASTFASAASTFAAFLADAVAQADARITSAGLFVARGLVLTAFLGAAGVGAGAGAGVGRGGGAAAGVVRFLVFFTFLLAGLGALRVFG